MTDVKADERVETVYQLMREVFKGIWQRQEDAWLHTDLSMAQAKALAAIATNGDPSVGVVARELNIGLPAASQIVERLVKAGLVERRPHPHDRRITQCCLSEHGENLRRRFQTGPRVIRDWLQRLAPDDLESLERGLGALAREAMKGRREGEGYHGNEPQ